MKHLLKIWDFIKALLLFLVGLFVVALLIVLATACVWSVKEIVVMTWEFLTNLK